MVGRYKIYPEFKDSGVKWLGDIPADWEVKKLKYLCRIQTGSKDTVNAVDDGKYPFFVRSQTVERINSVGADCEAVLTAGDGVGVGKVYHYFNGKFDFHQRVYMLNNFNNVLGRFVYYYLSSNFYKVAMEGNAKSTVDSLRLPQFLNFEFSLPSIEVQSKIANFLDHETAKIDTLITKQEKLIELLKEKRQAVISHAVTKGLNPQAPMKDSGVEWLGEVPEHWVNKAYRYACKIYRGKFGHRPRNDPAFYDGDYPFIQTGDVARAGKYIQDYKQTLNDKGITVSQKFPIGTLMMAIAANIGDTAILGFEAYAPDSVVGFKPKADIDLEFLRYSFMAALPALEQTSTQSTQANLNVDRIGAVKATFPPLEEQKSIVQYLDTLLERYDAVEEESLSSIELMRERKTALISAAVTGKIDVRDWQPQGVEG